MFYFSKSKYCGLWQCPKIAWLRKYKPEEFVFDADVLRRMEVGNEVGDLAMGLFGDFTEVTVYKENGRLDLKKMMENTAFELQKGTPVICEASFEYRGLYCAVDILKKENGGWAIYEVKSTSRSVDGDDEAKNEREIYLADIAYQKYVLERCGVNVTGVYLVTLNKDYVFDGTLDISRLFLIIDEAEAVKRQTEEVVPNLEKAEKLLNSPVEPQIDLSPACNKPYRCVFWKYCSKHLPKPSVFDLYRINFSKAVDYYKRGLTGYPELYKSGLIQNDKQLRQLEYALYDMETYVDKAGIREFLDTLSYPLYFLDFETMQYAVPRFVGTRPYTQVPFQYSLHYIEREGGELKHKEFLAVSGTDPRRALAERLCEDIPKDVCTLAYFKGFECGRLKELAEYFPDLSEQLLNIRENVRDLLTPFQSGFYYNRAMGGSFSIKSVLPAAFPNDPELNYGNLDEVHNGSEAMSIFPKIKDMPPEQQEKTRENFLKYCGLDTYAMVKLWQELVRVTSE